MEASADPCRKSEPCAAGSAILRGARNGEIFPAGAPLRRRPGNKGGKKKRSTEGVVHRGYRCDLKLNRREEEKLLQAVGAVRHVYNAALEQRRNWWRQFRADRISLREAARAAGVPDEEIDRTIFISLSYEQQARELTACRAEFPWLAAHSVDAQQSALRDLAQAYRNFFEGRARYPRPRRRGVNDSMRFAGRHVGIRHAGRKWAKLFVPKIGELRIRTPRRLPLDAMLLNATITRLPSGKWVASLAFELPEGHWSLWRRRPGALRQEIDPVAANRQRQLAAHAASRARLHEARQEEFRATKALIEAGGLWQRKRAGRALGGFGGIEALPRELSGAPRNVPVGNWSAADLGVATHVALADGWSAESLIPRLEESEVQIRRLQAKLAEQLLGGKGGQLIRRYREDKAAGRAAKLPRPSPEAYRNLSRRAQRTRLRIAELKRKQAAIRRHACHEISTWIVERYERFAFEDLKLANMTRSGRGTLDEPGINVAQKAGLNRAILACGWGMLREMVAYKLKDRPLAPGRKKPGGKKREDLLVLVNPRHSSQECRECGYTDAANRESQARFCCVLCGHEEHADLHAARNIEKRAFGGPPPAPAMKGADPGTPGMLQRPRDLPSGLLRICAPANGAAV